MPDAKRWWPHTHGDPDRYTVRIRASDRELDTQRRLSRADAERGPDADRFELSVNGTPIFARGVVWTPVPDDELRRDSGDAARCRAQPRFASSAPPCTPRRSFTISATSWACSSGRTSCSRTWTIRVADEGFRALVETEVRQVLDEVGGRPSLAVLCGNSEVEQQVGMLGLDPALGRGELFARLIPGADRRGRCRRRVRPVRADGRRPAVPNRSRRGQLLRRGRLSPSARRRPPRAVPFASECLAFANVPDATPRTHDEGVMRDVGASWDFADVRDHYLRSCTASHQAHEDYWERSRFVTGEVMAEVFGEWRRECVADERRDHPVVARPRARRRVGCPGSPRRSRRSSCIIFAARSRRSRSGRPTRGSTGSSVHIANDGPQPLARGCAWRCIATVKSGSRRPR